MSDLSWTLANFFRKDTPILSAFPMLVEFSHCPGRGHDSEEIGKKRPDFPAVQRISLFKNWPKSSLGHFQQ